MPPVQSPSKGALAEETLTSNSNGDSTDSKGPGDDSGRQKTEESDISSSLSSSSSSNDNNNTNNNAGVPQSRAAAGHARRPSSRSRKEHDRTEERPKKKGRISSKSASSSSSSSTATESKKTGNPALTTLASAAARIPSMPSPQRHAPGQPQERPLRQPPPPPQQQHQQHPSVNPASRSWNQLRHHHPTLATGSPAAASEAPVPDGPVSSVSATTHATAASLNPFAGPIANGNHRNTSWLTNLLGAVSGLPGPSPAPFPSTYSGGGGGEGIPQQSPSPSVPATSSTMSTMEMLLQALLQQQQQQQQQHQHPAPQHPSGIGFATQGWIWPPASSPTAAPTTSSSGHRDTAGMQVLRSILQSLAEMEQRRQRDLNNLLSVLINSPLRQDLDQLLREHSAQLQQQPQHQPPSLPTQQQWAFSTVTPSSQAMSPQQQLLNSLSAATASNSECQGSLVQAKLTIRHAVPQHNTDSSSIGSSTVDSNRVFSQNPHASATTTTAQPSLSFTNSTPSLQSSDSQGSHSTRSHRNSATTDVLRDAIAQWTQQQTSQSPAFSAPPAAMPGTSALDVTTLLSNPGLLQAVQLLLQPPQQQPPPQEQPPSSASLPPNNGTNNNSFSHPSRTHH